MKKWCQKFDALIVNRGSRGLLRGSSLAGWLSVDIRLSWQNSWCRGVGSVWPHFWRSPWL